MAKYSVIVSDSAWYPIEAENEEEAIRQAWEWFIQRTPNFDVEERKEDEEICAEH